MLILLKALFFLPKWIRRCMYVGVIVSGGLAAKRYFSDFKFITSLWSKEEDQKDKK